MEDEKSSSPGSVSCPICQRALRRTSGRLLTAFECEQCGPFSDFNGASGRARSSGADRGPDDSEQG